MQRVLKKVFRLALAGAAIYGVRAQTLTDVDVGAPGQPGSMTVSNAAGGAKVYTIVGGGNDIWNNSDNFHYAYLRITGDFDYVMKVESLVGNSGDGGWTKVELMARQEDPALPGVGPQGGDPHISNMTTRKSSDTANSAPAGQNYRGPQWRAQRDGASSWTAPNPAYPPNMPDNWVRLERVGSVFYMYSSNDGKSWNMYRPYSPQGWDTANSWPGGNDNTTSSYFTAAWPNAIFLGIAVTAHNDSEVSKAVVSNFGPYKPVPIAITQQPPATLSITENSKIQLSAAATGDPLHFQWMKDGSPVPTNGIGPSYTINYAKASDAGSYTVKVFGGGTTTISSAAVVTVTKDTTPPMIVKATPATGFTTLTVNYSKPVNDTALSKSNYALNNGLTVSSVTRVDLLTVALTTSKMAVGTDYALTVNGVQDTAASPNTIAANTKVNFKSFVFVAGTVIHEKYHNVNDNTGNTINGLFNDPRFPAAPDRIDLLNTYEYPANAVGRDAAADPVRDYFDVIEGVFVPPTSGNYVFFTSFADRSWLFLSTDDSPANMSQIIALQGWSDPRHWLTSHDYNTTQNRSDTATSNQWPNGSTITLQAGQKYYLLLAHHDPSWAGGDWFAVTYKLESQTDPADGDAPKTTGSAIGTYLDPNGAALNFVQQPADLTIPQGRVAMVSAKAIGTSAYGTNVTYQWQSAPKGSTPFANVSGAVAASYVTPTLALSDSGTQYRLIASVPTLSSTSAVATVTVVPDVTPPKIAKVSPLGVIFQETNGVVVVEAEHFYSRANATDDNHHYAIVPDELTPAELASPDGQYKNARGGKYMVSLPDSPGGGQNRNTADLQAAGPYLDFKVQINTPGEYQLYARAMGYDGSSDSGYARILELQKANGGTGPDWYRFSMNPDTGDFATLRNIPFDANSTAGWTGYGNPEVFNGGDNGDDAPIVWTIAKAGVYTIRWQQREDGNGFDALVLQRSNLPVPASPGPAESALASGPTALLIAFDESLDSASAQTTGNYALSGGATVSSAVLGPSGSTVVLTTAAPLTINQQYTLTIGGLKDMYNNAVPAGTTTTFSASLVAPPTAQARFTGLVRNPDGSLTIQWTGGGTLQAAPAVTGPWQDVTGATSPYNLKPTSAAWFGRIKQ